MTSLKTRLVGILLSLMFLGWVASALLTFALTSRVMLDQVDRQLEQYADLVKYMTAVFARQVDKGVPLSEPWLSGKFETAHIEPMVINAPAGANMNPALNIWLNNKLIAVMADSPRFDSPAAEGFASKIMPGGDGEWRVLTRYDVVTGLWLQVGIEMRAARLAMLGMLARALLPLLIVLPLTVALLYFGVSRGLGPLKALAGQIAKRNPGLLEPVGSEDVPTEMLGVVESINQLLQRLALALENEQRFTANAAHELLTPLAAIKTEVQLCQLQLSDESGSAMLARIAQRVDRASHTVAQLLTLARLDPDRPLDFTAVNLRALLEEVLADTAHVAKERELSVVLEAPEEVLVLGNEDSLLILLCNVLLNAFRYASEHSEVRLRLRVGDSISFAVENVCAPLSKQEFSRIFQRFYRAPGTAGQGAGLGLSIVARISEQHLASCEVGPGDSGQGFRINLVFPAATGNVQG